MSVTVKQFYTACMSQASYMVTDPESKRAAIIDPIRDVDQYVNEAENLGVEITDVILTHSHADFVGGHAELQKRGATLHLSQESGSKMQHQAVEDGDHLMLGDTKLEFMATPGHTPDSMSVLVYDLEVSDQPLAVATGDTAFVGGQGRVDLTASGDADAQGLAEQQFESIQKLKALPDETILYPGHGAGSLCGNISSKETSSTIGQEKRTNPAFLEGDRQKFVSEALKDLPFAPQYFQRAVQMNLEGGAEPAGYSRMSLSEVQSLVREGAQVLDTRHPAFYAKAHLPGSINIGMAEKSKFAPWAGALLDSGKPIVVVAESRQEAEEAQTRLRRVSLEPVGYLQEAMEELPEMSATHQVKAQQLAQELDQVTLLDIRTQHEREGGRIPGSLHIPLHELQNRLEEVPGDKPVVVHCAGGYRSSAAMGLMEDFEARELVGGFGAWKRTGLPTE